MVVVKHAALLTSTLLSKVLAAPNIKLFNATAGACPAPSPRRAPKRLASCAALHRVHCVMHGGGGGPSRDEPISGLRFPSLHSSTCLPAAEDLIVKDEEAKGGRHVAGAVTNWTLVSLNHDTQMCMVRSRGWRSTGASWSAQSGDWVSPPSLVLFHFHSALSQGFPCTASAAAQTSAPA